MSARINHVAVWAAAIVYWLLGALWYTVLFGNAWMSAMGGKPQMASSPTAYLWSFILGLVLAYATGIALARHPEDQTVQQGISFALFMGIALFASQTAVIAMFSGTNWIVWLIDTGYVVVGFAIIGAIVGGWKQKVAAA